MIVRLAALLGLLVVALAPTRAGDAPSARSQLHAAEPLASRSTDLRAAHRSEAPLDPERAPKPARPLPAAPASQQTPRSAFVAELARIAATRASAPSGARPPSQRWIESAIGSAALRPREDAALEVAGVRHVPLQTYKEGLPVWNRRGRLHLRDGAFAGASGKLGVPLPEAGAAWNLDATRAVALARETTGVRAERATPQVQRGWFAQPGGSAPAWRVMLASARPLASYQVTLHAGTGAVLDQTDLLLHATGSGSVYDPNLQATPAPVDRVLYDLDDSGRLSGRLVRVFDERGLEAFRPDRVFRFPIADPRFVQTNVYRSTTDMGRLAERLGFPPFGKALLALANFGRESGAEYNNAFYDPLLRVMVFGNGDGVVTANLGTDGDVAAHEMGHHLFQELVDPERSSRDGTLLAMNEATADTFAALLHGDPQIGETTLPGQPALRDLGPLRDFASVDSDDPHEIGLVYASANWDLYGLLGRDVFGRILIAGLPFLSPEPELPTEYRDALRSGDVAVYGGTHRYQIDNVFAARHFDDFDRYEDVAYLDADVPREGSLGQGESALFFFSEFPGSTRLEFRLTGTGNADLLVAAYNGDPNDPDSDTTSEGSSSNETIVLRGSTAPSVHDDDRWVVLVRDYPYDSKTSTYSIRVVQTLPPASVTSNGTPYEGSIDENGEVDLLTFSGTAGRVVRLTATALAATLDPAIVIFDPSNPAEALGRDDDDGPGNDSLIQGVRLPDDGTYAIAVFSPAADVDPTIGTGGYRLVMTRCTASEPDTDGDGLADPCDDDDDQDEFDDPEDDFPLDAQRCVDFDEDLCDDCASGAWNFLADGPDVEGDGYCDTGDEDDDNDGCTDDTDASPLSASLDDDLDFRGDDCDNCPAIANATQADCNDNGAGDACDATPCPEPDLAAAAAAAAVALARLKRWSGAPSRARARPGPARSR